MTNDRGHTLTELMISAVMIIVIVASVIGAFVTAKWICDFSLAQQGLQRDVAYIAEKIIVRNPKDSSGIYALRSAASFNIPLATPSGSRIDFTGTDGNTRSYFVSNNSILYNSPTQSPNQQTVYTAPANSTLTLLFWYPSEYIDNKTVGISVSVSQTLGGNKTVSGSVTTYVNLRNMPQ